MVAGNTINIDTGAAFESAVIQSVGTAGATGTGVTLTAPLANAHASGAQVTPPASRSPSTPAQAPRRRRSARRHRRRGRHGRHAHRSARRSARGGRTGDDRQINVDVDQSGGNQETVTVTNVGTAGAAGTGVDFTPALVRDHVTGAHVAPRPLRRPATPATSAASRSSSRRLRAPPRGRVCGRVVIPVAAGGVSWWTSNDCGAHYSAETQILPNMTATHSVAQNIRTSLLPTSAMDGGGEHLPRLADAELPRRQRRLDAERHRDGRDAGSDGGEPEPGVRRPQRIPIEADNTIANTNDHFIPGISADPNTGGATAHLGLYYFNYPVAACNYVDPAEPGEPVRHARRFRVLDGRRRDLELADLRRPSWRCRTSFGRARA